MLASLPWWRTDTYDNNGLSLHLVTHGGPNGVALVRVWESGKTDEGWGQDRFMARYKKGQFKAGPILASTKRTMCSYAYVMRSMKVVCIDVDGKNGGYDHVGKLGMLPYTLAETSKSGDGYHLFYTTEDDEWDDDKGFAMFSDRIGLEQGVDFRATGCVFHYDNQRWNSRPLAELPQHLKDRLVKRDQMVTAQIDAIIKILDSGDQTEVLMMHDALLTDLAKPIPAGRRNNTLFAIGNQMKQAKVYGWEQHVEDRAKQVGLDSDEILKLISNIQKYGPRP